MIQPAASPPRTTPEATKALPSPSPLEQVARPLLELMQSISGLETTFITQIDWDDQTQEVVYALNSAELQVTEGSVVDWSDSMCRWVFLSGQEQTSDVKGAFPDSLGAKKLGMETFFAVPVLAEGRTIGTVCGASRQVVEINDAVLAMMRLVAMAMAVQLQTDQESRAHSDRANRAEVLALTDDLTGLPNRRAFNSRAEQELARSARHPCHVAVLMLDVDEFKAVNDQFGHAVGDQVLQAVAQAMRSGSRVEDVLARLGGDEFALTLSNTDAVGAVRAAERVRRAFAELSAAMGVCCSISIGLSTSEATPRRELIAAADQALYRSKALGRNRVEVWAGPLGIRPVSPHLSGSPVDGQLAVSDPRP